MSEQLGALAWVGYVTALAVLLLYGVHRLVLIAAAWRRESGERAPTCPGYVPAITVQLPLYNEPNVALRLIDAACRLDWPREHLEIQVLDDSNDGSSKQIADAISGWVQRGINIVHLRRSDRAGYKAGALEAGRLCARGELCLILDADFVPSPDLLRSAVPFFADPTVGMVQLRWEHINARSTLLTRVQAMLLDGHFAVEQSARFRRNVAFNFNGTAGIWRASAVASAGGWHADTLTEDLDLSYRAALAGWRFVYLGHHSVPAELPARMPAFRSQQYRWAKGSIEVARKIGPAIVSSGWPSAARAHALLHVTHNLPYLATAALMAFCAPAFVLAAPKPWMTSVFAVSAAVTAIVVVGYVACAARQLPRRSLWSHIGHAPALVALTCGISVGQARAVVAGVLRPGGEFVRTPKDGVLGSTKPPRSRRTFGWRIELALAGVLSAAAAVCLLRGAYLEASQLVLFAVGAGWVAIASAFDL